ncbi:hypothetical protein KA005_57255 [bacterium]|nr:hypothetical protein [bacterium]
MNGNNGVFLKYLGNEFEQGYGKCEWEITITGTMRFQDLADAREKASKNVTRKATARDYITRRNPGQHPPKYLLGISGRGEDGRCAWCRYLREVLWSYEEKKQATVTQIGCCDFEE